VPGPAAESALQGNKRVAGWLAGGSLSHSLSAARLSAAGWVIGEHRAGERAGVRRARGLGF
jgi:hypothetical protein